MLNPSFSDSSVVCASRILTNPALMLATYECSVCGLRDRAQIDAAPHQRTG